MKTHRNSANQGFTMVLVMIYIFLAVAVVAAVSTAVMSAVRTTDGLEASRNALEAAEYGEMQAISGLSEGRETDLGLAEWRKLHAPAAPDAAGPLPYPGFGEPGVAPVPLPVVPGAAYVAMAAPVAPTAPDAAVAVPERAPLVLVYAAGRCGNATRRVEAIYRPVSADMTAPAKQFTRIAWRELPPAR